MKGGLTLAMPGNIRLGFKRLTNTLAYRITRTKVLSAMPLNLKQRVLVFLLCFSFSIVIREVTQHSA